MTPPRPRLADVAARAGVSEKTVSNFVNGYPYMSETTRAKVQAAIEELGYRVNLSARSMGSGRTGFIALAVPTLDNPYFAQLAGRVIAAAAAQRWTVLIEETGGRKATEDRLVQSMPYLVDGMILQPEALSAIDLVSRSKDTPIVLLEEPEADPVADHVAAEGVDAAKAITEHLVDTGRRRIATIGITPDSELRTTRLRHSGHLMGLEAAGVTPEPELWFPSAGYSRADGDAVMAEILASGQRPDAVLCFNAVTAAGALSRLHMSGVRVPEDIAVAAFDDIDESAFTVPPLTTVAWDLDGMAEAAVQLLAERQSDDERPPRSVTLGYELKIRESTAIRPAGAR
ncbi:LacI family DNA-binding transcriptional regulator [Herbiconiux sp. L3-i23]|uniref:LacI family DNA-binding transcriptional regulator n=1 Tax=Herbiconiux sp. L3-i23 TaxID=2905871 RepID=UPI00205A2CDF|nr:LacI family DNA-binding transcriptional regulator [Herbiconiux sp. L3-i23]BDI22707.1 LacI family transcriptional regulator [Herbiconiux sp. L3-i23]